MKEPLRRWIDAYGMVLVLVGLCAYFSWATWSTRAAEGAGAAESVVGQVTGGMVVVAAGLTPADREFTRAVTERLVSVQRPPVLTVNGSPPELRAALVRHAVGTVGPIEVLTTAAVAALPLWESLRADVPGLSGLRVVAPRPRSGSQFLAASNLRNIADQIAVIAIMAVGMTAVIITGGIDLSVGSLLALAAVCWAWLVARWGGEQASNATMLGGAALALLACSGLGLLSGFTVTRFRIPPFIVTLAMMQVASGLAFMLAHGQSIYALPANISAVGRGADHWLGLPYSVWLMLATYVVAHVVMSRTAAGRAIYALGGNPEAARLSGLPTSRLLVGAYAVAGFTAGLGGLLTVSQLRAGAPTYGLSYELYVIAAVVVGGASLSGGSGSMAGTLVGAFIIAVIRNGMNLMGIEPYSQKVVLGVVILLAVLLDQLKQRR